MSRFIRFRTSFPLLPLVAAGACLSGWAQGAQSPGCDASTLRGSYAIQLTGIVSGVNPTITPVFGRAEIGIVTFDGAGNFTGKDTYNVAGVVARGTLTGTYTVNADCTGSLTVTAGESKAWQNADIVVFRGGRKIDIVQTDPVSAVNPSYGVLSGVLEAMSGATGQLHR